MPPAMILVLQMEYLNAWNSAMFALKMLCSLCNGAPFLSLDSSPMPPIFGILFFFAQSTHNLIGVGKASRIEQCIHCIT